MKNPTQSRIVAAAFAAASMIPAIASAGPIYEGRICVGKTHALEHMEDCQGRVGKTCDRISLDESCSAMILNRLRDGQGTLTPRSDDNPALVQECIALFEERLLGAE